MASATTGYVFEQTVCRSGYILASYDKYTKKLKAGKFTAEEISIDEGRNTCYLESVILGTYKRLADDFVKYDLFKDEPALFFKLANLKRTTNDIMGFINQYGTLHETRIVSQGFSEWSHGPDVLYDCYDTYEEWSDLICQMDSALSWAQSRFKDRGSKEQHDGVVWMLNRAFEEAFSANISSIDADGCKIDFQPKDLKAALWLQFVMYLNSDIKPKKCVICDNWFATGRSTPNTEGKKTCSNQCRQKLYRHNKKRKIALSKQQQANKEDASTKETDM